MRPVSFLSTVKNPDPKEVLKILKPVMEAEMAGQRLSHEVLNVVISGLDHVVDRPDQVPPLIYKPVITARELLLNWKDELSQVYLTNFMARILLMGVAGGAVGQMPNILEQINVRYADHETGYGTVRHVTAFRPELSFPEIYRSINAVPWRKQNGVDPRSRLMQGPAEDKVKVGEHTFILHFENFENPDPDAGTTRDMDVEFLKNRRGEKFADPFLVAMAEAASLARDKKSLFQFKGHYYVIRTAVAEAAKGNPIHLLSTRDDGVDEDGNGDSLRYKYVIPAGTPRNRYIE